MLTDQLRVSSWNFISNISGFPSRNCVPRTMLATSSVKLGSPEFLAISHLLSRLMFCVKTLRNYDTFLPRATYTTARMIDYEAA